MPVRPAFRLACVALASCTFISCAGAFSDEAVAGAEDFLKETTDRFARGEVTRTDVAQATFHLLEMRYRAGKIPKRAYCEQSLAALEMEGKGLSDEARIGQRTTRDLLEHRRRFYEVKVFCE
jgi:outer membrane protein TolC